MIFEKREKRTGKKFIIGSKYWPDGTRFRRRFSNKSLAKNVLRRIEGAIAMGTWKELRKELAGDDEPQDYTIREFADLYLEEYCKIRNTRPDFKEERLRTIKDILGTVKLREFTSADAAYFEKERAESGNPQDGKTDFEGNDQPRVGRAQSHVHICFEEKVDYGTSNDAIWTSA